MHEQLLDAKVLKQYFHQRSGDYQIAECLPKFKCGAYQSSPDVRKTEREILLFWNIKTKSTLKVDFLYLDQPGILFSLKHNQIISSSIVDEMSEHTHNQANRQGTNSC